MALLSGHELPEVRVPATSTVADVKKALAETSGYPMEEQRRETLTAFRIALS